MKKIKSVNNTVELSNTETVLKNLNYYRTNNITYIEEKDGAFSIQSSLTINDYIDYYVLDPNDRTFALPLNRVYSILFDKSDVCGIPLKCSIEEDLEFRFCDNLKQLDCKTIELRSDFLSILQFNTCVNLKSVFNINATNTLKIIFHNSAIQNIHMANKCQAVAVLCINACDFSDLSEIKNGIYDLVQINETLITCFNKHNAHTIHRCEFDCSNLISFTKIDDFVVSERFILTDIDKHCNNIINILNNTCDNIIIEPDTISSHVDIDATKAIIRKYLALQNRKNYLMDCTIELLDKGFNTAAEL